MADQVDHEPTKEKKQRNRKPKHDDGLTVYQRRCQRDPTYAKRLAEAWVQKYKTNDEFRQRNVEAARAYRAKKKERAQLEGGRVRCPCCGGMTLPSALNVPLKDASIAPLTESLSTTSTAT